mmetsp:Transcript_113788/g.363057  ORF Transcript_113788/g.363057 Transcript_113788/m.363057 type:complete len:315 (-) Transcript_113788:980-1924(-)
MDGLRTHPRVLADALRVVGNLTEVAALSGTYLWRHQAAASPPFDCSSKPGVLDLRGLYGPLGSRQRCLDILPRAVLVLERVRGRGRRRRGHRRGAVGLRRSREVASRERRHDGGRLDQVYGSGDAGGRPACHPRGRGVILPRPRGGRPRRRPRWALPCVQGVRRLGRRTSSQPKPSGVWLSRRRTAEDALLGGARQVRRTRASWLRRPRLRCELNRGTVGVHCVLPALRRLEHHAEPPRPRGAPSLEQALPDSGPLRPLPHEQDGVACSEQGIRACAVEDSGNRRRGAFEAHGWLERRRRAWERVQLDSWLRHI